jgi:hypothetical protein
MVRTKNLTPDEARSAADTAPDVAPGAPRCPADGR